MGEPVHTARIRLVQNNGHFAMRTSRDSKNPCTSVHMAATRSITAGSAPSRFRARGISTADNLVADVEGRIEGDDKFFRIAAVNLPYKLKIPTGKRAEADRALAHHEDHCSVHMSIKKGFEVTWSADVVEE